jgi:uncharacterized protein (TIGR03086 family)
MTDPLPFLRQATDLFDDRLATVKPDQWTLPTPCTEWTVRDLVDHVTGGNRWAVALLDGEQPGPALETALRPGFGDDILDEYRAAAEAQYEGFAADGALEKTCHHFVGDIDGAAFSWLRIADLAVHAWDLARATGGDEHMGDELVTAVWAVQSPRAQLIATAGMFGTGASGTLGYEAPLQHRLLDMLGRRP